MKNAYIKFILAAVIFGTNGIIASQLPLSSYEIVLTRTVLGGLFLLLLATARHEWGSLRHVTRASLGWLVLSGLFLAGNWLFLYEAYQQIGVSLATLSMPSAPVSLNMSHIACMICLGVVNTGLGYYLYFSGVQRLSAQSVSICGYLEPFTALALSALILRENLTSMQWLGAACILGGVALSELWHPGKKG